MVKGKMSSSEIVEGKIEVRVPYAKLTYYKLQRKYRSDDL